MLLLCTISAAAVFRGDDVNYEIDKCPSTTAFKHARLRCVSAIGVKNKSHISFDNYRIDDRLRWVLTGWYVYTAIVDTELVTGLLDSRGRSIPFPNYIVILIRIVVD
jgi:hypothetical protein